MREISQDHKWNTQFIISLSFLLSELPAWLFSFGVFVLRPLCVSLCVCAVLCADRVGQMTKTYSDIDAVTRLLEEVRSSQSR